MSTLSPRKANTFKKVCSLTSDNKYSGTCDIMVSEHSVSLFPDSRITSYWVSIPKKDFNKFVDWYNKEQKIKKK